MKRLATILTVVVLLGAWTALGAFLGIKKSSETISLPLLSPLDSAGIPGLPDSAHILTYADNASAATYTARSTTYPFADISIDTLKIYGDTTYWLVDAVGDLDGAGGNFVLGINVALWYKAIPTYTFATVQVVADSLNVIFAYDDSIHTGNAIADEVLDTLQNQDDWVASAAALTNAIDSIHAILDTLQLQDGWVMAKTDSVTVDMSNFNTSLDNDTSLVNFLRAGIGSASNAEVLDSLGKILDSLYASATISDIIDSFLARDAFWDSVNANAGTASVDTMSIWRQVWRALPTGFADSTGYIAQLLHDTLMALMDSIQNHDNWVAQQTEVANINGWNPSTDSVNVDVSAAIASNNLVGKIAAHTADSTLDEDTTGHYTFPNFAYTASQTAASSFNPATDSVVIDISKLLSTLTGQTLTLGRFVVTGANGANPTVLFENTSVSGGPAFMVDASSDAYGAVNVLNDGTGQAILLTADTGMGFNVGYTAFSPNIFTGYHFTAAYYDSITAAAGGSSNWSDAQRDSVLAVVADAGKLGVVRDSVNAILDTMQVWDDDVALLVAMRDSINAILDTLQLYDGRLSEFDAASDSVLAKANVLQISNDATAADNLEAMLDGTGGKKLKANIDGWVRPNDMGKIVVNGGFSKDSVSGSTAPYAWVNIDGTDLSANMTITAIKYAPWNYMVKSVAADTFNYVNGVGYLPPGKYILHGVISNRGGTEATIYIDSCVDAGCSNLTTFNGAYIDSITQSATPAGTFVLRTDTITLPATNQRFMLGFKFVADAANDSCLLANIGLEPFAPMYVTPYPVNSAGDTLARLGDSTAFQGAASGLDSATVYAAVAAVVDDSNLSGGSSGTGIDTLHVLALDTSGTDTALFNTKVVVKTLAGSVEGNLFTGTSGDTLFTLTATTQYAIYAYKAGWIFEIDTVTLTAGMTDTIFGYNAAIGTPSSADLCRTYLWAYDPQGSPIAGAVLTAILQGNRVQDTCNNTVIVKYENVSSGSDATGYLYLDLTKSKCLSSQNKYDFKLTYPSGETVNIGKITVPDSSTYRLDW